MKKIIVFFFCLSVIRMVCQNPSYQQKMFYTCKVWGFVKYYHSGVSTCQVNWDSALVSRLPYIKNAVTLTDFNNQLDTLLQIAGPMAIAVSPPPAPVQPELKRNLDFNWFSHPVIRNDIKVKLDTIWNNFRPHPGCWAQDNTWATSYGGWLVFPHDNPMYNANSFSNYPNEFERLLIGFKYWNIINYFNPYNYVLDQPCDSILNSRIVLLANAADATAFYMAIRQMAHDLNDAHAQSTNSSNTLMPFYPYSPAVKLTYTQNKYIVSKSNLPAIKRGDEVVAVNGIPAQLMEDSLRPYMSFGNSAVFHRTMCAHILNGPINTPVTITYIDSSGSVQLITANRSNQLGDGFFYSYHPNDTLGFTKWKKFNCNIGYVNMGRLLSTDVSAMYNNLKNTSAIIFDLRKYPNATAWDVADLMYPGPLCYAKNMLPDINYPGTFYWHYDSTGITGNPSPYTGKVIMLINEETQSQGEYTSMIFGALPNSVKVGSQTAGADGNITYFSLSTDIRAYFTNLGIFYPNGDSTQRIGIVPDSVVYPSPLGIRRHRDELLEKALEIANCITTAIKNTVSTDGAITVFPNPAYDILHIQASTEISDYELADVIGKTVLKNKNGADHCEISLLNLKPGVYYIRLIMDQQVVVKKFIKE